MQVSDQYHAEHIRRVADALYSAYEEEIRNRGDVTVNLGGVALFVTMVLEEVVEMTYDWRESGMSYKELMRLFVVLLDVVPQV